MPGFNSKGKICRACDMRRSKEGGPKPGDYDVVEGENPSWALKGEAPAEEPKPAEEKPKAEKPKATVGRQPAARKKADPEPTKAPPATTKKKTTKPKAQKPKAEKPKAESAVKPTAQPDADSLKVEGLVLYVNAMPARGVPQEQVAFLTEVLAAEGLELARSVSNDAPDIGYYDLDAFKRRDQLASQALNVARDHEGMHLVALGAGQDLKAYVDAIEPFASVVVRGIF